MGFWPFGGGKKGRQNLDDQAKHTLIEKPFTEPMPRQPKAAERTARSDGTRGREEKSRRLSKTRNQNQKNPSTNPNSRNQTAPMITNRHDNIPDNQRTASPQTKAVRDQMYRQSPMSQSSIGPEEFSAVSHPPTLRATRRDHDSGVPRQKSAKRKAEEYAREREIRAMSSPITGPRRPASYSGSGPLQRDTKQIPGDLNRRLQRPTSEISLPKPEAIGDSDDLSQQNSFKVGMFAALSPRPTVRYNSSPRNATGKQVARTRPFLQEPIEEEENLNKARINDLADDLDAGGLRELMERDRRRRERKKESENARLQRKLQRKAERQREAELRKPPGREPVEGAPSNVDRAPMRQEEKPREKVDSVLDPHLLEKKTTEGDPFADPSPKENYPSQRIRNPFEDEKDIDVMQEPLEHGGEEEEEPPLPVRSPLRTAASVDQSAETKPSTATISPPTSPLQPALDRQSFSQASQSARDASLSVPETAAADRRASDQGEQQLSSWTSFFKRGGKRKPSGSDRGRTTPSEFSNTSRESFTRKQPPPIVPPRSYRRSDSNTPQRTLSKFREDLPEFPISPPDSRVQSPEASSATHGPLSQQSSRQPVRSASGTFDASASAAGSSNLALDRGRPEGQLQPQQSMDLDATRTAATEDVLPQTLASVDSEGSWLSGKPVKRLSGTMSQQGRLSEPPTPQAPGTFENEGDEFVNDEYLSRLTPGPEDRRASAVSDGRKASSTIIDLQRENEENPMPEMPSKTNAQDETWHEGLARQATVVRQANRAKSKEGLLKDYMGDEGAASSGPEDDDDVQDLETPDAEIHEAPLMRARSIGYKGHARHMSAGSAKLLDIRRSSVVSDSAPRTPTLAQAPGGSQLKEGGGTES